MIPILLLYILVFILVYTIDLCTALLHRKIRPNNFARTEANQRFRNCIEQRGIFKGIGSYIILSTTESVILFAAVLGASKIVFDSTISRGFMFAFLFLTIVHILGTLTNLVALWKKDKIPKVNIPQTNLNTMGAQNE